MISDAPTKKGARRSTLFLQVDFALRDLPGSANGINPELFGVRWPVGRRAEGSATCAVGRDASELVVNGSHRVLGNAPRVVLLHGHDRRHHQGGRLAGAHPVVAAVPRSLSRLIASPVIPPTRMPRPSLQCPVLSGVGTEDPRSVGEAEAMATKMMTGGSLARTRVAVADDDTLPEAPLRHQKRRGDDRASEDNSLIHTLLTSFISC